MNKNKLSLLFDGALIVALIVCELTGLMLHNSDGDSVMGFHTITGILLLFMMFGHIYIHRHMLVHSIAKAVEG